MLMAGDRVQVVKGCRARSISAHTGFSVVSVESLGAEYGHQVRVVLTNGYRRVAFYARHINRLADPIVRLNDGRPEHTIEVKLR